MTTIYNIAADQLALDDDISARPPRALARQQPHTARITCRVCAMPDQVPLDAPGPLCRACGEDLPRTREKARAWLDGVLAQMDEALETWHHAIRVYRSYWEKIQEARVAGRPDADAKARTAHRYYGLVLDAEAEMLLAFEPLGIERARLESALTLLDDLTPQLGPGEYLIPIGADVETCRSCGASIVWTKTPAGKAVPLSLALVEERGGVKVTKTHFVDCPDGRGWKR